MKFTKKYNFEESQKNHQIRNKPIILISDLKSAYFFTWEKLGPKYFCHFLEKCSIVDFETLKTHLTNGYRDL